MLDFMKKYNKIIAVVVGGIVAIGGVFFTLNMVNRTVERNHLMIGSRQEGEGESVSMGNKSITDQRKIEEITTIIQKGKKSNLTDENIIDGKEIHFNIEYGTYTERKPKVYGTVWFKADGTAIYRDGMEVEFYELAQEDAATLEKLLTK